MKAIIIYNEIMEKGDSNGNIETSEKIEGGIYTGISYKTAAANVGEENILLYIPLNVSGKTYQERKADLQDKAVEWSNTQGEYTAWSYGELADISDFFETNARRYGLLQEFRENAIC